MPARLRTVLPLALFIGVPAVLILPILLSGKMLYGHDVVSVFHYSRIVIADAFRSGRLPVWDPHVMAGFPMLAEPQNAVFYPPTWLCIALPAGLFWTLSAGMHLSMAGAFAQRWLERGLGLGPWAAMTGGFVWMLSGFSVGHLYAGHVNYVWGWPWIPALLWRLERQLAAPTLKRGVLLATVLAMLFLAGVPQFVFFAGLLTIARLGLFVLSSREGRKDRLKRSGQVLSWMGLGLLFCAPQLFPTLELIGQMQRLGTENEGFLLDFSMPLGELPRLALGGVSSEYWWEACGFVGGATLLLAIAAFWGRHPQRVLWAVAGFVAVLLALGPALPLYRAFTAVVPGAGLFRGPGRYLLIFTLAAVALSCIGFETLWSREKKGYRIAAGLLAMASAVQLLVFAAPWLSERKAPREQSLRWPAEFESAIRERVGLEGRVASARGVPVTSIGKCQAAGVDQVGGYEPMMLRRYAEVMNAAQGSPIDTPFVFMASVGKHRVVDMLAVQLWINPDAEASRRQWAYSNYLPRAWVVNNAAVIESKEERLRILAHGPFDPSKSVILEEIPNEAPPVPTDEEAGRAKVLSRGPGRYVVQAHALADAYLVLSEAYYPGWEAEIDGRPVPVLPANHLLQAVRLPAGKHTVTFGYRSRFLGAGFAVALAAMLVPAGIALVRRRRG